MIDDTNLSGNIRPSHRQRGGAVFYTFVVTPLALGLLLLTIDLAKWNSSREYLLLQSERIALQSTQALPNRDRAESIGSDLISRLAKEGIVGPVTRSYRSSGCTYRISPNRYPWNVRYILENDLESTVVVSAGKINHKFAGSAGCSSHSSCR